MTVVIPSSGTALLGSVQARVAGQIFHFSRNVNTIAVACGDRATLSAIPAFPSSHPFTAWSIQPGRASRATELTLTVDGLISVRPDFLLPRPVATPTQSPSPRATPTPSASSAVVTLDRWVSFDAATRTLTWKAIASYQGADHGLNFDGEAAGAMRVSVPEGWSVTVEFSNMGPLSHSAVVVTATGATPAFPGAGTPNPTVGTPPGQTATYTFTASQVGSYRLACLVPGHEAAGMWAGLTVVTGGLPTVQT
ncbi:MAG TPA: sulfocyanin-like copper-binding protein [Candidatus Dormibacteraeota bacterium]|nr:sulfocyanin-like copper-binding protein [Candidatus Dormibacteraeota bacterium]